MHTGRAILLGVLAFGLAHQTAAAKADKVHEASAIACAERGSTRVTLRSTDRLPEASGTTRVERKGGTTEVEVELDSMKPASLFGGDYNTYVLWVVPPGGPAQNLGEILLDGSRARLRASTDAKAFAILVTAEPHFLAAAPSAFVVLENKSKSPGHKMEYPLIQGVYNFDRSTLDDVKEAKGRVHTEVKQAFTALRLAQRAGAASIANSEFERAKHALEETLTLWHERKSRVEIAVQARETVRLAVAAQRLAEDRAFRDTRIEAEGSGGGKGETARRDPRGVSIDWR